MKDHIFKLRRKMWIHDWPSQLYTHNLSSCEITTWNFEWWRYKWVYEKSYMTSKTQASETNGTQISTELNRGQKRLLAYKTLHMLPKADCFQNWLQIWLEKHDKNTLKKNTENSGDKEKEKRRERSVVIGFLKLWRKLQKTNITDLKLLWKGNQHWNYWRQFHTLYCSLIKKKLQMMATEQIFNRTAVLKLFRKVYLQ